MKSPRKILFNICSFFLLTTFLNAHSAAQRLIKIVIVRPVAHDTTIYVEFYPTGFAPCPCPHGIPQENFEVYDDSSQIKNFEFYWGAPGYYEPNLTYAYIVDASVWNNLEVRKTTYQFVNSIRDSIDEGMLVVARSGDVILQNPVGSTRSMIMNSLDSLTPSTGASIYDAIKLCYDSISINNRNPEEQKIIFITAGKDSGSLNQFDYAQFRISSEKTSFISVGMNIPSQSPEEDTLKQLSFSSHDGIYVHEPDSVQIENVKCNIRTYISNAIDVNYIKYHDSHLHDGKQHYVKLIAHDCGVADTIYFPYKYRQTDVENDLHLTNFYLAQNYPNPFSSSTTIQLPLLVGEGWGEVVFKIYDLLGREVLDLSNEANQKSEIVIRNSQLPHTGIYFYRLTVGNKSQTKMMTRIK